MAGVPAAFPAFWDAFGGSVFLDEYKGDFRHAQSIVSETEEPDVEQHGRALLFKIVLETLKGNLGPALQTVVRLATERPQTEEWNRRGILYTLFCLLYDISPQFFSFAPYADGFQREMYKTEQASSEQDIVEQYFNACERWNNASVGTDLVSLERSLIMILHLFILSMGKVGPQIDRQTAAYNTIQLGFAQRFVSSFGEVCNRHAQHLDEVDLRDKGLTPRLRHFQVLRAAGDENAPTLLETLIHEAGVRGDRHGTALCIMHKADSLVSAPVTHITYLNMPLVEGTGAGLFHSRWDTQEPRARLLNAMGQAVEHAEEARALYREAITIADDISANRLSAAIHLRLACLRHFEAFMLDSSELTDTATELEMAYNLFSAAGDEAGCRMVDCHFILVAVIQRDQQHIDQRVQSIIQWYETSRYRPFMHCLGILICRFGFMRQRSYNTAALCYEAALKLFRASDHSLSAFQVEVEQGKLLQLGADTVGAIESLNRATVTLENLVETWGTNARLVQQPRYNTMVRIFRSELAQGLMILEQLNE